MTEPQPEGAERIRAIEEQIADLKKRWPAHSVPPGMMRRLDELEDELDAALARQNASTRPCEGH